MEHESTRPQDSTATGSITIRSAREGDADALRRLAELDSAPTPPETRMLVAEAGQELLAARPMEGGAAIANPFRPTAFAVELLDERLRQLRIATQPSAVRPRWIRLPMLAGDRR